MVSSPRSLGQRGRCKSLLSRGQWPSTNRYNSKHFVKHVNSFIFRTIGLIERVKCQNHLQKALGFLSFQQFIGYCALGKCRESSLHVPFLLALSLLFVAHYQVSVTGHRAGGLTPTTLLLHVLHSVNIVSISNSYSL